MDVVELEPATLGTPATLSVCEMAARSVAFVH
jgi:hypothetical protein